jgi:hypothetical protein
MIAAKKKNEMSLTDFRTLVNSKPKKNKFNAVKVTYDGIAFDSTKEYHRYLFLKSEVAAGRIYNLGVHVPFEIKIKEELICVYEADFVYMKKFPNVQVVEDVKSVITRKLQVYQLKKKMMWLINKIKVVEV